MTRLVWLPFLLLCTGWLPAGQSNLSKAGKKKPEGSSSSSGDVVEAGPTGCLQEKDGTFSLEGYILKGHEKELAGHDGDEVRVTGTMALPQGLPQGRYYPPLTTKVKTVEILHVNNPAGRAPMLGPVASWKTILSPLYGLQFRVPKTFTTTEPAYYSPAANFVSTEGVVQLGRFTIRRETYAQTNFGDGSFAVFVNPNIHTEGGCSAFGDFRPKLTSSAAIHGIGFRHTVLYGAAAGTGSSTHYFHTYQSGLCFEFDFNFDTFNSLPDDLPYCAVQQIYRQNERQLTDALLSAVRFVKPQFQPVETETPRPTVPPTVTSFAQTPVPNKNVQIVRLTWSTEGADYVQIHFPRIKNISVGGDGFYFYDQNNHNFPPSGHANLLLGNYTKAPVSLEFTIEPFRAGVAYPKQSKTLILTLNPRS